MNVVSTGFHEAVSEAVILSVMTPKHMHRIGLLSNITDDYGKHNVIIVITKLRSHSYKAVIFNIVIHSMSMWFRKYIFCLRSP